MVGAGVGSTESLEAGRPAQGCWLDARGPGRQGGERLLAASWAADLQI